MLSAGSSRIARNTFYLYLKQIVFTVITFATVGITLDILGETDYGINNVIAGTVSMFTFLSGTLSIGNQRFYAYYLGKGDYAKLKQIIGGTLTIYISLTAFLLIVGETVGLWFLNNMLVIPAERLTAANWLYQFGLVTLCLVMLQTPFTALLTAHENMKFYAWMSVWDAGIRIATLYLLVTLPFDKLIALGAVTMIFTFVTQCVYFCYIYRKYPESHTLPVRKKEIIKELLGFNVWNLSENLAYMVKNQGTAFILNIFYGPVVNAAHAISVGVREMGTSISVSFHSSVAPQVTKSYAADDKQHMFKLAFSGSKIIFLLMAIIVIPALFNIEIVLDIWLPVTPEHTVVFCRILLIEILLEQMSALLAVVQQATGKIRSFQLLIGFYGCLNLPVAYIALKYGCAPEWVFVISLILQLFAIGVRVGFLKRVAPGARRIYLMKVALPCITSGIIAAALCFIIPETANLFIRIPVIMLQIVITAISVYLIAFNPEERLLTRTYIRNLLRKLRGRK